MKHRQTAARVRPNCAESTCLRRSEWKHLLKSGAFLCVCGAHREAPDVLAYLAKNGAPDAGWVPLKNSE